MRRFIVAVTADADLRGFVQREPALALRVLMDPEGPVAQALRVGLAAASEKDADLTDIEDETYAVTVQVATSLVWANVAGGLEPQVDSIIDVLRKVLQP